MRNHSATIVDGSFDGTVCLSGWRCVLLVVGTVLLVVAATPATASIITTVPTSLSPGDQYRLAFMTSTKRDGLSSDIADYNTFVDDLAETVTELAALNQDWKAIASTSAIDARTNTATDPTPVGPTGVPIFLLNDTKIADNYDDLWDGTLDAPLGVTELGVNPGGTRVRTGTGYSGLAENPLGDDPSKYGVNYQSAWGWIKFGNYAAADHASFYAMSGTLTVEAIPEPSSVVIWAIGTVGLMGFGLARKRRKAAASKRPIHTNH